MATVKEKIAYLRGMLDSTEDVANPEKLKAVLYRLMEVLEDLADDVEDLYYGQEELEDYLEAMDADLADLEEYACECHEDDRDEEFDMVEMECPNCQCLVSFEEDLLYEDGVDVTCPECGEVVYSSDDFDEDDYDDEDEDEDDND
ncbi:MAG: CD1247 N-terminal domain-containing protein [Limnochordia bacterium]|nr:zinc ribbon domain-containing protein [Bacillota bacterium]HOB08069.1 zinc ribbon domain-containing protein [Limnochordia bacterium]NLH32264.1 zinc ribbon domain-containing protein [Bacillota bacterium]HPT92458.1 zinc ribbon domain-containing protein [Limnochordia bacterium]HPZ30236.1 zinc ribbon domain-containing protein [Limnochordia bacterium]